MVAPAFGFSVGDFVAGIELIGKAAKALRKTSGAAAKYQHTILELELLESVLRRVQALEPTTGNADIIKQIELCSVSCQIPLARFLKDAEKFRHHLKWSSADASNDVPLWIIKNGRRVQWAVVVEEDVARLKDSMGLQIATIHLLLQLESMERSNMLGENLNEVVEVARKMVPEVEELRQLVCSRVATQDQVNSIGNSLVASNQQAATIADTTNSMLGRISSKVDDAATGNQMATLLSLFRELQSAHDSKNAKTMAALHRLERRPMRDSQLTENEEAAESQSTELPRHRRSSKNTKTSPHPEEDISSLQLFLVAIRRGLWAVLVVICGLFPRAQVFLRAMRTMLRSQMTPLGIGIALVDGLNRPMSLPYEHFRYWPVLEARLKAQFASGPGEHRVAEGSFALFRYTEDRDQHCTVMPRQKWESWIAPGSKIVMSLFVRCSDNTADGYMDCGVDQRCSKCVDYYRLRERDGDDIAALLDNNALDFDVSTTNTTIATRRALRTTRRLLPGVVFEPCALDRYGLCRQYC